MGRRELKTWLYSTGADSGVLVPARRDDDRTAGHLSSSDMTA
jgi:hypothetical protein